MTPALAGKRVTVVGLGRFGGGVGAARWLCGQGAHVTVSDKAGADELAESIARLEGLDVALHLGSHRREDFLQAELLVVNPAVPPDMPLLVEARGAGVAETTEINLFLQRCRAPIAAVTGSTGKSTTAAMTAQILAGQFTTHLGGNIGRSLLEELPRITSDHVVVLELSSFQLERTALVGISPHVAVVTNLWPNHLDRHGTMEAYAAAKKNIFAFQSARDVLILNAADQAVAAWRAEAPGRVDLFDPAGEPFELSVPGTHNQANAQAAWAAARQLGVSRATAAPALREFEGLPHRLQLVAERDGVRYYNDSKSTLPQGAIAALEAFEARKSVIIVGGYDKGVTFDELAAVLAKRAKCVIAMGATRDSIIDALKARRTGDAPDVHRADDLASAVDIARRQARRGQVVLLSPACASLDMFTNYEQRGEMFTELVRQ